MSEDLKKSLRRVLNASGFLFQLAVEHELDKKVIAPGSMWKIIGREHRWVHKNTGDEGYIDLLLDTGTMLLVIECKRVREGVWIFPIHKNSSLSQTCRLLWTHHDSDRQVVNWHDFIVKPYSFSSMFCVVRGHGEGQISMLERIASNLLLSTEALAEQDLTLKSNTDRTRNRILLPIIITNADLFVAQYDPGEISLASGMAEDSSFEPIPYIRFRKSLASGLSADSQPTDLQSANTYDERSVIVLNSIGLVDFFSELDFPYFGPWPWEHLS